FMKPAGQRSYFRAGTAGASHRRARPPQPRAPTLTCSHQGPIWSAWRLAEAGVGGDSKALSDPARGGKAARAACYRLAMTDVPFAQRIVATLVIRERQPGEEALETVQWQMPDVVFRLFQREARRQKTDLNSLLRDLICTALTEQAEAVRARTAELDQEAHLSGSDGAEPLSVVLSRPPLSPAEARQTAAEEIIDRGWDSCGVQRCRLAHKALVLWPDGADAYVLLASTAKELA